jgi:hypothetical protein
MLKNYAALEAIYNNEFDSTNPQLFVDLKYDIERVFDELMEYHREVYKPLEISKTMVNIDALPMVFEAMRLAKPQKKQIEDFTLIENLDLSERLVKAGDEHAKALTGLTVTFRMHAQCGWLMEFLTYQIGMRCLGSDSDMHTALKKLAGIALCELKQKRLSDRVYTRIQSTNYQTLRRIYLQRRSHKHEDWQRFCDWIESLPYAEYLIYPTELMVDYIEKTINKDS